MHPILKQYALLTEFLGKVMGPQYEFVLLDLEEQSLAAISNGHISGRSPGAPMTNLAVQFIREKEYEKGPYKMGYQGLSGKNGNIHSATMFIKDDDGKLLGMFCINYDASRALNAVGDLAALLQLNLPALCPDDVLIQSVHGQEGMEVFHNSVADMVSSALEHVAPSRKGRLTKEEKLAIMERLNQRGLFQVKGAVSEVAGQLRVSEATVYRYLSQLNKQEN